MFAVRVPEYLLEAPPNCAHCHLKRKRNDTFVLQSEAGQVLQVGRMCLKKFLPGEDFTQYKRLSDRLMELTDELERSKAPGASNTLPASIQTSEEGERDVASHVDSSAWDGSQYSEAEDEADDYRSRSTRNAESFPAPTVSVADLLKFLIDRTGYIKLLEAEDTPEAFSRIENLRELVNAAMDSRDRGEALDQFLDHAALVADADDYDARSQITLMSLHAAKGLEFPLVFLSGLEEGLFPHSRTMLVPEDIEEERRLCYVGMTRAMDQLVLTRAVYRRRYGTDLPEASVPSRFLEEVPAPLFEELGAKRARVGTGYVGTGTPSRPAGRSPAYAESTHYSYEDEDQDQSATWHDSRSDARTRPSASTQKPTAPARPYNSIENIAEFFASRGKKFTVPKVPVAEPTGKRGFRPGQKVRHPKYGEGTVYQREGEGEEAKITVQFPRFGLKKLVEKYAQLERA
jgi:DNA helicase-2/ATP-dependent DNA helicase PcrA